MIRVLNKFKEEYHRGGEIDKGNCRKRVRLGVLRKKRERHDLGLPSLGSESSNVTGSGPFRAIQPILVAVSGSLAILE